MLHSLSQIPWATVDSDWVIEEINVDLWCKNPWWWTNGPSQYSRYVHRIVRETIPAMWDEIIAKLLNGRVVPDSESRDYDVILNEKDKVEVKTARIWSTASIRKWQLDKLGDDDLYWLVYYETKK